MSRFLGIVGILVLAGFCAVGEGKADLLSHAPIQITGDELFTEENGVVGGSGTKEDPYLISGFIIDASEANYGIRIENTTAHVRIWKCHLFGAEVAGIRLVDSERVSLTDCSIQDASYGVVMNRVPDATICGNTFCSMSAYAVHLEAATRAKIHDNHFSSSFGGMILSAEATNNSICRNVFSDLEVGIVVSYTCGGNRIYHNDFLGCASASDDYNRWDDGSGLGNYWSDYTGKDRNGDSVGDSPYPIPSFLAGSTWSAAMIEQVPPHQPGDPLPYGTILPPVPTYEQDYHPAMQPFRWEEED